MFPLRTTGICCVMLCSLICLIYKGKKLFAVKTSGLNDFSIHVEVWFWLLIKFLIGRWRPYRRIDFVQQPGKELFAFLFFHIK